MQARDIESLIRRLRDLLRMLRGREGDDAGRHRPLAQDDPAVRLARDCELMVPEGATPATLAEAAQRRIATAEVLLERARGHQSLPPEARLAAEEGYLTSDDDLLTAGPRPGAPAGSAPPP